MRYEGTKQTVLAIENQIKTNAMGILRKRRQDDNLFGVKSIVETKIYDVLIPKQAYLFPVRIFFDNRVDRAVLDVRDRDMWWLCKVSPMMVKLLGDMTTDRHDGHMATSLKI